MSKTIPDLYAAVCAKRPELAVPWLAYDPAPHWRDTEPRGWCFHGDYAYAEPEEFAAALILARWVEMLPVGNGLYHAENYENGETRWWIGPNASMPTPIEALAAFWLQQ